MTFLLTCIRIARSHGVIKSTVESDPSLWNNLVPFEVLRQGLCHSYDDVRLDVFSLLCESYKTTEPIKEQELEYIKFFIHDNFTNQSPAFRQNMMSAFKKVCYRLLFYFVAVYVDMDIIDILILYILFVVF